MAEDSAQEKTEEPTAKRKRKARESGDVARSEEVNNAIFLVMALFLFGFWGSRLLNEITSMLKFGLSHPDVDLTIGNLMNLYKEYALRFLYIVLPFALIMLFVGIVGTVIQVGWLWTPKTLEWKWNKIYDWSEGFKRIFSASSLKNLGKSILIIAVLSWITVMTLKKEIFVLLNMADMTAADIFYQAGRIITKLLTGIFFLYSVIASLDYVLTKFIHDKKMKMSKSEKKDEFRQMEGDPQIRNKIRSLMMEESRKRMMEDVPESDVVITNPVHLAVAVKYDAGVADAPKVLAKGKRLIAEQIKKIARENNIPVVEDKPLARMLYKTTEVGEEINIELYEAVAEILAVVYKEKKKNI
ncbi:MAG: flagellar biosynthesis protein FlhB [Candidatus Cloacimonadota bacterium]|nr:MAG: flagellar biosynthesis protein FlhB [Candidatus Cloacimonadota bacterium]